MKTTTEIGIKVSGAKVTNATVMPNGTCKLTVEMANGVSNVTEVRDNMVVWVEASKSNVTEVKDNMFVRVEASKLSLNDEFMQYEPETGKERKFKRLLVRAIKSGVEDFKRPKYDPSFNKDGICYKSGKAPAVGKSYNWWNQVAKEFKPEYNSRLGTKTEYVAFLGVLIKQLVEMGWSIKKAWDAVCNDSKELGHYWNSENAKHDFESTGCREICGFYDLANCYKILAEDEEAGGFWIAGGYYNYGSNYGPLAGLFLNNDQDDDYYVSVGWLVLD